MYSFLGGALTTQSNMLPIFFVFNKFVCTPAAQQRQKLRV